MILQTQHMDVGYGKCVLLPALRLSVDKGEIVVLLGKNGSGKSTLMRTLCGLQAPLSGTLKIDQEDAQRFSAMEWSTRVALVHTRVDDTGFLDVFSLVALGRMPYTGMMGNLSSLDLSKVENALQRCHALHLQNRIFAQLSDGEKQRVLIARAIAQDTPLVIMDEPTAFLDFQARQQMHQLLSDLVKETQKSIIISTHEIELALKMGSLFWIIGDKGIVFQERDPQKAREILHQSFGY
jgi:iron complex transport system ATP-binding protein